MDKYYWKCLVQVKDAAWDGVFVDLMSQEVQNRSQIRVDVLQKTKSNNFPIPSHAQQVWEFFFGYNE